MLGRGIDQIFARRSNWRLHEACVHDARRYVDLAEHISGPFDRPASHGYIWGVALDVLDRYQPDARIINLETSITTSNDFWLTKGIHYRMHPANVACLNQAKIDCCVLANNHVIDWGYRGLSETLERLRDAGLLCAGAGEDAQAAAMPAAIDLHERGRVLIFGVGSETSGIPSVWAAREDKAGVSLIADLSEATADDLIAAIESHRKPGDLVIVSIHWGDNWGYEVPDTQRSFAHRLLDSGLVDCIHGHSSHHAKGIEIYRDKPILYGCGDLLNDYEGITGHEQYRSDIVVMYMPEFDPVTHQLTALRMMPAQLRRFTLNDVSTPDAIWFTEMLSREGARLETRATLGSDGIVSLHW